MKNFTRVRSIRNLINLFTTVNFTWSSYGELSASSPREPLGLFIQSVPLCHIRGSHLLLFFCFSLEHFLFSKVLPPYYSKHISPSPVGTYLSSSYSLSGNPVWNVQFQMFHLIFITFSWYLRHFAPKGQICHSDIFRGLRICISMMSVGLINPFQKFREVFICFAEFPEYCSNPFALVSLFKALLRCTNKSCSAKSLPRRDPESVQLWVLKCASCIEDPPYEKGCNLGRVGIFPIKQVWETQPAVCLHLSSLLDNGIREITLFP